MGYLGLVPGARSTGDTVRCLGKAGNEKGAARIDREPLVASSSAEDQRAEALRPRTSITAGTRHHDEGTQTPLCARYRSFTRRGGS
jgi:hypothetical protein